MYKRIRYSPSSTNIDVLVSMKTYQHPTNGARYKVILDTTTNQWSVVDDTCGLIAVSGHNVNFQLMKKQAKEALETLGVPFSTEKGVRKPYTRKAS